MKSARTHSQTHPVVLLITLLLGIIALRGDLRASEPLTHSPHAIVAGRYMDAEGNLQSNQAILLRDGKIVAVMPADQLSADEPIARYPHAVVTPGLIDVHSNVGAWRQVTESSNALDLNASTIDAVDPYHRDFRRALEAGVTTIVLAPAPNNLVSGVATVVKTHKPRAESHVLRGEGPLCLALGPEVFQVDREPTSRMGAIAILRRLAGSLASDLTHARWKSMLTGELPGIIVCGEAADASAILRIFGDSKARWAMAYAGDEHGLVDEIAESSRPVILGPLDFATSYRGLTLPAALAAKEVPLAFRAHFPSTAVESLRISAHLAVRHGLDPSLARRAITSVPAEIAGVADRVGAIRPEMDADLVIFSDDPLRLDATVIDVFVDGVRVYSEHGDSASSGHFPSLSSHKEPS